MTNHGGPRPPSRPDDGRLVCKVKDPTKVTITLSQSCLDRLRAKYGSDRHGYTWQDWLREVIDEVIAAEVE